MSDLDRRERELMAEIDTARGRLDVLQVELRMVREEKSGIKVGDIVRANPRTRGRNHVTEAVEAKVTGIRTWREGKPWITAVLRTKSGAWGKQNRNLFDDWEKL